MVTEGKKLLCVKAKHYTKHKNQFNQIGTIYDKLRILTPRLANRKKNICKKSKGCRNFMQKLKARKTGSSRLLLSWRKKNLINSINVN